MDSTLPAQLGIWRLGKTIHSAASFRVRLAQPADAKGSPRWDYAIKVGCGPESRDGIIRSVSLASVLSHPNLVPILDGDAAAELPYLVMPYLDGQTMGWHLHQDPRKPLPVMLWFVRQICQGLQALHASGWSHGDIKPDNVIVGSNGHVTLIDFAFAHDGIRQQAEPFRGTPDYAAPEVLANASLVSPASDVFAVGKILWQWVTKAESASESLLDPICNLVELMAHDSPASRPTADQIVKMLLRLEIDSLGNHIVPAHRAA